MSLPSCPECLAARSFSGDPDKRAAGKQSRPDLGFYSSGYICCVHDSLTTAIEHILSESPGIKENEALRGECLKRLERIYAAAAAMEPFGKERPCIIMKTSEFVPAQGGGSGVRSHPSICIMGTFEGTPLEKL
ncbi:hypothetical protein OH77DRAFT_1430810 [Trametes cingulata]|nr:hypothetical protein OH77DRAFT_1430810 [Trametes cingulata]